MEKISPLCQPSMQLSTSFRSRRNSDAELLLSMLIGMILKNMRLPMTLLCAHFRLVCAHCLAKCAVEAMKANSYNL